jgi:multidrug transporter EmrE-like cation transporter
MHWLYLFIAIILEVAGTTSLKASDNFSHLLLSIFAILAYCASFYFLSLTLKTLPVGVAYGIWSGFGIAAITLIGYLKFKQSLDLPGIIGILLIISGVLVLNLLSKTTI